MVVSYRNDYPTDRTTLTVAASSGTRCMANMHRDETFEANSILPGDECRCLYGFPDVAVEIFALPS